MTDDQKRVNGTKEWAASNANVMLGCKHDCRYCYARASAVRFGRTVPELWLKEVVQPNLARKRFGKRQGTVMFPTTHDITMENMEHTLPVLGRLLKAGNKVLVVSKPQVQVIERIILDFDKYKDQVLFRFTIGSKNDEVLKLWEPGAPSFYERLSALGMAFWQGWKTSVSMEPMLDEDEDAIVACFNSVVPFVTDSVWLGKMNKAIERLQRNGFGDDKDLMAAALWLVESQNDQRILSLYDRLKSDPRVKWKESIKAVVGLALPTRVGLDV
jgi:DNA repair photolyase